MFSASVFSSAIDHDTVEAYRETHYRVLSDSSLAASFDLQIDQANAPLLDLYAATQQTQCAFITACNPISEATTDAVNDERQAHLLAELQRRGLKVLSGIGQHPTNGWPGEPSFLVLGIALEASKALGSRYQQNAIVWAGPDAVPKLILLR